MSDRQLITEWLARTDPNPGMVYRAWEHNSVALLPLGRIFDAVRVPCERMHAAVGSDVPRTVAAALLTWLDGPVIRDLRSSMGPYYVLIPPDAPWDGAEECLGNDTYLGVPRPGVLSLHAHWVVLPSSPGHLCEPARLAALLATAEPLAVES
ncbi:hypothetical protein GPA10_04890 [Streptomyces sp. p1417]|uniref:Bifunctional DNA primase/polymerase, N-terminal n=1 Tax=Streptomyces typhae TaxID=2681492 RepID=A0A6L6WPH6_9ACTN|nr:hypothetical protein [Streptomyces typhae]MVO84122.1 hypothetical protein [Streptomyces typhae]